MYRTIRMVINGTTSVYASLYHEGWMPEVVRVIHTLIDTNNSRVVDDVYIFTDGRLVYTSGSTTRGVVARFYRVRNATWLVYLLVTRYEWDGKRAVELGVTVHGSREVYNRVRRFLRRLGLIT